MTRARRLPLAALVSTALLALAAGGCGSTPKTQFYTLGAGLAAPATVPAQAGYRVAVGPVTVPDVVDRPQLVVRLAPNRVELLEQHRWAEPLKSAIPRVIAADLTRLLGAEVSTESRRTDAEYHVRIEIGTFESLPGESVALDALWSVRHRAAGATRSGRTALRVAADGPGYEALAAAHANALAQVSRDIATAIQFVEAQSRRGEAAMVGGGGAKE